MRQSTDSLASAQRPTSQRVSTGRARAHGADIVEVWVDEHGNYLFGYALPRVRDRHLAEELVQETFLAALESVKSF